MGKNTSVTINMKKLHMIGMLLVKEIGIGVLSVITLDQVNCVIVGRDINMNDLIISFPRSILLSQVFNKLTDREGKLRNYNRVALVENINDLKIFCGYSMYDKIKKNKSIRFKKQYTNGGYLIDIHFVMSKKSNGIEVLMGLFEDDIVKLNKLSIAKGYDMVRISNDNICGDSSSDILDLRISFDMNCVYESNEGNVVEKVIREKTRDKRLRKLKLQEFSNKNGSLYCECCGLNFESKYGTFGGENFVEVHHDTKKISDMEEGDVTTLNDLAVVCCNCHEVIHRNDISVKTLKEFFENKRRKINWL